MDVYRVFFDQSPEFFCTVTQELFFLDLNPTWERVLGWTQDELRSRPITDFIHPDDQAHTRQVAARLVAGSSPLVNFVNRYRDREGNWVPLSWVASYHQDLFLASARDLRSLEQAQQESLDLQSRFQSILDSANYSIIETTPDGTIREFNRAAERMLGYSAAEVVGKFTPAIIHDMDEVVAYTRVLEQELGITLEPGFETFVCKTRQGQADEKEWTYVRKDGSRFPVNLCVTARRNSAGEIIGFMGIASDLTLRKAAEARAREGEVLLKTVFSSMAEGVVIQNRRGAIVDANAAAETILKLSRQQLLGKEALEPSWQSTHLDGSPFPPSAHPSMVCLATGQVQNDVEMSLPGADGVSTIISVNSRPISKAPGERPDLVVSTFRDITKRVQAEKSLQESETRSRAIIDSALDAFITIDAGGVIERVNPAVHKLFGYQAEELLGQNVKILMPSPFREEHDEYLRHYLQTGVRKVIGIGREVFCRRADGSEFPAELAVSEVVVDGRKIFTGVLRDLSERKRVERLQSEFVSTVSHELRTPLTSIRGSLGLLAGGMLGDLTDEALEYVEIALKNSERLVRLINDILDIEKIESGNMEFRLSSIKLSGALLAAVQSNQGFAATHQVTLRLIEPLPAGESLVDPDRLAQVLANLISNAVKFSPAGAEVQLSLERRGRWFRISVRDQGAGIPKEFESRIFGRFSQADSSSTREKGGTGLGLSITKALVERMGGRIGFTPGEPGGTVFFVDFPYLHPVGDPETDLAGPCILVCEDDGDLAGLLEHHLSQAGYRVHLAPTGERARRLLKENRYDAMTLDLMLADGESLGLISEIRASQETSDLPVIVISGSQSQLSKAGVLVTAVLIKPIKEEALLEILQSAVHPRSTAQPKILHVEDDADVGKIVQRTLPQNWQVVTVQTIQEAQMALEAQAFDIVLLDLSLPDGNAECLLERVGSARVVIFSAQDSSADLARRVSAALVKSRSTPIDVRDTILRLLGKVA